MSDSTETPRIGQQGRLFKMLPPGLEESRIKLLRGAVKAMFSPLSEENLTTLKAALAQTSNYAGEVAADLLDRLESMHQESHKPDFAMANLDDALLLSFSRCKMIIRSLDIHLKDSGALILNPEAEEAALAVNRVEHLGSNVVKEAAQREITARTEARSEGQNR